jgi:hypothetical protein
MSDDIINLFRGAHEDRQASGASTHGHLRIGIDLHGSLAHGCVHFVGFLRRHTGMELAPLDLLDGDATCQTSCANDITLLRCWPYHLLSLLGILEERTEGDDHQEHHYPEPTDTSQAS